jgi:hypothetical protein
MKRRLQIYLSIKGWRNHLKAVKRQDRRRATIASYYKHESNMRRHAERNGKLFRRPNAKSKYNQQRPAFTGHIPFWSTVHNLFSNSQYNRSTDDGHFLVPHCFSLLDNHKESFNFLKKLFVVLHKGKAKKIVLDYKNCERIDVDASICMDIILAEFINYRNSCQKKGFRQFLPGGISAINFDRPDIEKVLFSIGAYSTLRDIKINFEDIEPLPVLINYLKGDHIYAKNEIDLTKIVEYIKRCLQRLGRELTVDAESEFYKVIGEVMSNAEEHSTVPYRYAIGFFQEINKEGQHFGVFNFCIFNFGDTIYDTFKSPSCKNPRVVTQMRALSEDYTKKGWFLKADFEEETLWTLYAMQEGVTSKEKKRGNGSIQYLENFFKLRGESEIGDGSKMILISGNTRILFDGHYKISKKTIPNRRTPFKMITFNDSGQISDKPDKKYVTFAPHYFPGTLISARILIKDNNTNLEQDGQ